jgi:ElaB/YqjD/DUF883 family membrane-anchored ribosome-binding protein
MNEEFEQRTNGAAYAKHEVEQQIERLRTRLDDLDTRVRRTVQERPVAAMGAALVLGYALGRLLARR